MEKWKNNKNEIRKILAGKNGLNPININSFIKNNGNNKICKNRFNFSKQGNRCISCNEFSYLSEDGNLENENIVLDETVYKTTKYDFPDLMIEYEDFDNSIFMNNLPDLTSESSRVVNKKQSIFKLMKIKDQINRELIINICMEWHKIDSSLVALYMCDNFVVVRKSPIQNNYRNIRDILKRISYISSSIIHGEESLEYLDIYQDYKKVKVVIRPSSRTSVIISGYKDDKIFIPSLYFDKNYEVKNIPINILVEKRPSYHKISTSFPMMDQYKKLITFVLKPTEQLFEFYEKTCMNIFPCFRFYLWIIALMSNQEIYETFDDELMNILFYHDDIIMLRDNICFLHNKKTSSHQDIKEFCINNQFKMKFEILEIVKNI